MLDCKQSEKSPQSNQMLGDDGVNDPPFLPEWLHCPTEYGARRYCKECFAAMLERAGVTTGTPPALPAYCVEEPEDGWNRCVRLGLDKWTYFARGKWTGRIKIGQSNNPNKRVRQLDHSNFGEESVLLITLRGSHFEKAYHDVFAEWCEGHEWFAPHPDILAEIERLCILKGLDQ